MLLYQTWAFGIAGVCAGVAGALLAGAVGQLDGRAFAASESVMLFALTIVGGAYHWVGALLAGLLLRAVPSLLIDFGVNGYPGDGLLRRSTAACADHRAARHRRAMWLDAWARLRGPRRAAVIEISALTVAFGAVVAIDALDARAATLRSAA